jgi:hypothetical protein
MQDCPGGRINRHTKTFLDRLELYLARTKSDLGQGNYAKALANCAEMSEISRRFWLHIEALLRTQRSQ